MSQHIEQPTNLLTYIINIKRSMQVSNHDIDQTWHIGLNNQWRPAKLCLLCQVALFGQLAQRSHYEAALSPARIDISAESLRPLLYTTNITRVLFIHTYTHTHTIADECNNCAILQSMNH